MSDKHGQESRKPLARVIKRVMVVGSLLVIVYLSLSAKYASEYGNGQYLIDDEERIPLWYPYELRKTSEGVKLNDWRDYSNSLPPFMNRPVLWGRPDKPAPRIDGKGVVGILKFNSCAEAVFGEFRRTREQGECSIWRMKPMHGFFLFTSEMDDLKIYTDEGTYLSDCRIHGLDGSKLQTFDEKFAEFLRLRGEPTILDFIRNLVTEGVSLGDLLSFGLAILMWLACVLIFRAETSRLKAKAAAD